MKHAKRLLVGVLVIAAGISGTAAVADSSKTAAARAISCPPHDLQGTVQCFVVNVPENPSRPRGRRIDLEVMVLKARAQAPAPDPLFVLPGGPGQSATRSASPRSYFAETFDALRATRDIVLLAPRGTAGSNELSLQVPPKLLFASLDTVFPPEWARHARATLEAKADLRQYTTSNIVGDIDAIRRALGYAQINIYGTSYGTRVAQLFALRHPRAVRSMVLKAPLPLGRLVPLTYTAGAERALRLTFRRCEANPKCASAHPAIAQRFDALMSRLARKPAAISLRQSDGMDVKARITDRAFGYLLRNVLMSASGGRVALQLIEALDKGNTELATNLISRTRSLYATELAGGMALSVIAAEDAPKVSAADLARESRSGFLGASVAKGILAATAEWPRGAAPADLYSSWRSEVPTLIVTGEFDPATPPAFGSEVAKNLTRVRMVNFSGGSHSGENFPGLAAMITGFVLAADPAVVDAAAATLSEPLPLVEQR